MSVRMFRLQNCVMGAEDLSYWGGGACTRSCRSKVPFVASNLLTSSPNLAKLRNESSFITIHT
jgi:hypothetical protein